MTTTTKAIRANVTLGDIELDVFQLPDGSYQISQSQTCLAVNKPPKRMVELTRSEKGQILIQSGFEKGLKVKVEGSKPVNLVPLEVAFQFWVLELAIGNQDALALVVACGTEALERRADNAFGVVRDEEERNERLKARTQSKLTRRTLTDSIKEYIDRHPELSEIYPKFVYSNCTDCLNLHILGAKAKQVKEALDLKPTGSLRDTIPLHSLRELETLEGVAGRLIDAEDLEPLEACKKALVIMYAKTLGFE
jgi:hypothetical protein